MKNNSSKQNKISKLLKTITTNGELKDRLIYTLFVIFIVRFLTHVSVPGISHDAITKAFGNSLQEGFFAIFNTFSGGAMERASIIALGVSPYISASIVTQMLSKIVPSIKRKAANDGAAFRRKLTQYTRYLTVLLSIIFSYGAANTLLSLHRSTPTGIIDDTLTTNPYYFYITTCVALVTGVLLLMWLGERITQNGIGNGISLIICINILSALPLRLVALIDGVDWIGSGSGQINVLTLIAAVLIFLTIIIVSIQMVLAVRNIHLDYSQRTSRRLIGGDTSNLELKVNSAGVIPVIFAQQIRVFIEGGSKAIVGIKLNDTLLTFAVFLMTLGFTFMYVELMFDTKQIAENLKQRSAFIPGVRPGNATHKYIKYILNNLNFIGGFILALLASTPILLTNTLGANTNIINGTSGIIIVGVLIETWNQLALYETSEYNDLDSAF